MKKKVTKRVAKIAYTIERLAVLSGFAVSFKDRCEFWYYNPSILTKRQIKQLGITGYKKVAAVVKTGENLGI